MTSRTLTQQKLDEIISSFDYDGFKAKRIEKLNSEVISSVLVAAQKDDKLWQELKNWATETKTDFDAEKLREALPSKKSELEPEELLVSLGLPIEEAKSILDFLQSHLDKEQLIQKAFEADSPEETAKMLEKAVEEKKVNILFREIPNTEVLRNLLYFSLFAAVFSSMMCATVYKGVTPRD